MHKTLYIFPILVKTTLFFPILKAPAPFPKRGVRALEVLVNRLGGLSLPRKSVVRLTDRPDMTLDVYRGRKTTNQIKY